MNLNYLAFFLISFIPLIIGYYWYHPKSMISKLSGEDNPGFQQIGLGKLLLLFAASFALVYGYINLIIHQMVDILVMVFFMGSLMPLFLHCHL